MSSPAPDREVLRKQAQQGVPGAQYNLGVACLNGDGGERDLEAARQWFTAATRTGHAPAHSALGYLYLYGQGVGSDPSQATQHFREAADKGFAEAQYRLAELTGAGVGMPSDGAAARRLFAQAAKQGHAQAQCQLAYCLENGLGGEVEGPAAIGWYVRAAETLPRARASVGYRYETGRGLHHDPVKALAWYLRARDSGFRPVVPAIARLNDRLGPQERGVAMRLAERNLPADPVDPDYQPAPPACRPRLLRWEPRILWLPDLLSAEECWHLVAGAMPHMRPSRVLSRGDGQIVETDGRSSGEMEYRAPRMDVVVANIEQRVSFHSLLPRQNGEPLLVLHYGVGDEYRPHVDYFDPRAPGFKKMLSHGGQRLATILIYLNEVEGGGETRFPDLDLSFAPKMGSALMFFNCTPDGAVDRRTRHAGAPVTAGEKWLATRWLRQSHRTDLR